MMIYKKIFHENNFWNLFSKVIFFVCLFLSRDLSFGQSPLASIRQDEELLNLYVNFDKPDSLLLVLKKEYSKALSNNEHKSAGQSLQQMGQLLFRASHYPQALDYLLQADKIFRKLNDKEALAQNLGILGQVYYRNNRNDLARIQFDEALKHYRQMKELSGEAEIYGRIGQLYEKNLQYDSAFYFQERALIAYQKGKYLAGTAKIFENIGSIYEDIEKYDSAHYYFQKAYDLNQSTGDKRAQIEILNNLGDVFRKTGNFREGLKYSYAALHLAEELGDNYQISGAYNDLGKGYNFLNKNDSAFHYLSLSRKLLNAIYSQENNKQTALLQTLYEIEKKDREIEKLTQAHKNNILIAIAVGILILLLSFIAALIISKQRLKIKNEQRLSLENKKVFEAESKLMKSELSNRSLLEENLKRQLETKSKELSSYTLYVIKKNNLIEDIRKKIEEIIKGDSRDQKKQIKQLSEQITNEITDDQHWEEFRSIFEQVHQSFFDRLKEHTDSLTPNDLRLIALIKMNLSSKDTATLLGISQDSLRVVRYRLRKKLALTRGESLSTFIQSI